MSNLINYQRAAGLGLIYPGDAGGGTMPGSTGHSTRDFWGNIFNTGAQTVASIFQSRAAAQNPLAFQQPNAAQYQTQAYQQGDPNAYASGAITGEGIMLGNTRISWPTIALAVGALYLIQSPGFSRRR